MNPFLEQLRSLGPARLATMAGVAVGLIGFIIFFAIRFSGAPMDLLYGNLSPTDSREIAQQLQSDGVPFQTDDNGAEILVPADQVTPIRMQMAELGLPSGGSMGYEVFDSMDALGSTNFMQNVNLVRALEGELARTIKSIDNVQNARVHLVLAQREMFTRDVQDPTASVYIKMRVGRLAENQVTAVQNLIAAAIPRLKPSNISIVDERGRLLSRSFDNDEQMVQQQQEQARTSLEQRLAQSVISLVESSLGTGKVRAEVRADMDYDKVVTAEERFNPDEQVIVSSVTVTDTGSMVESQPDDVTVAGQLPDAGLNGGNGTARSQENTERTEETVNYEISKTTINQVRESGVIKRLSVAVLVDGSYVEGENGERVFQPLPEETMTKIESLVQSAVGYDANRGDQIEVINMPFTGLDEFEVEEPFELFGFAKEEILRMAEGLGVALVAVLVILLVVRPLVTRAFEAMPSGDDALMTSDIAQLTGPGGVPMPMAQQEEEEDLDELIDIDKVEGRVKASSLRKIGDIVDKHPEEALSIVRMWLYQES
ncbi:MAG TPA: flagellar M-ring protein FliF [Rhodospirillaceae bacterium]|nr:flagellar M-ring protein FliF [Rhodospirillaceae bacterium]